jgi:hypothetical protein
VVVRAQVRLIDWVLRDRLGCPAGLGDPRIAIVDPAVGGGAYPTAIIQHVGAADEAMRGRMHLFEAMPGAAALARARGLPVQECDALSVDLNLDAPIVVCLGNPPYLRRPARPAAQVALLDGFTDSGTGIHRKNLYNDYVYFWGWVLRGVLEKRDGAAIISLVTAASYTRGPAFGGLRRRLRQLLDDLWLIDLEGDQRAARPSDNVFPIRTPIAIALGVRYGQTSLSRPADVHYARLVGTGQQKLAHLDGLQTPADLAWQSVAVGWSQPLVGARSSEYASWPSLTELFPWQLSGAQLKRTWPTGVTAEIVQTRWRRLLELPVDQRREAFGPTRDRDIDTSPQDLFDESTRLPALRDLSAGTACLEPVRYAYRAFDRHWVLPDARCGDFMRPRLWRVRGPRQVFLTSMLTNVLGSGPAAVATALVPDLDHFRGSFGARSVIPLWCDAEASQANVAGDWLERLSDRYGIEVTAPSFMAYCYALLAAPSYTHRFEEELRTPGPRLPLTRDPALFVHVATLGDELIQLHTYREVSVGRARAIAPVDERYPTTYLYDATRELLSMGAGCFGPVSSATWEFAVSGYRVLPNWVRRRVVRRGRSPLDAIAPSCWTQELSDELLALMWLLEATLARHAELDAVLDGVISSARG